MSALNPTGIRIGTPVITTRGLNEKDMFYMADILNRAINIGTKIQTEYNPKTIKEFTEYFKQSTELGTIQGEITTWMTKFPFYE